jgi:hypothetical protein
MTAAGKPKSRRLASAKVDQLIRFTDNSHNVFHIRAVRAITRTEPDRIGTVDIIVGQSFTLEPVRIRGRTLKAIGPRMHWKLMNERRSTWISSDAENPVIEVVGEVKYQPVIRRTKSSPHPRRTRP